MSSSSVSAGVLDAPPDGSVAVVLGTRPEIVKLSGVIKLLGRCARVVHTGQHYDATMSDLLFGEMGLPRPHVRFEVGGRPRAGQIAEALGGIEANFRDHRPRAVVVQGDTNSTVAVVHVDAGQRGFDRRMPEEHNRVVTDHLFDLLCAATRENVVNLAREGIEGDHVVLTGNTIVEAVHAQLPPPATRMSVLDACELRPDGYAVAILHRPENTDDPSVLATILTELGKMQVPVVLSLHPRTAAAAEANGPRHLLNRLVVLEPQGSGNFLSLVRHAALVITDSGGLQEECAVLQRPFIVVRRSTERAESIGNFGTMVEAGDLIGKTANNWLDNIEDVLAELSTLPSPHGDGTASAHCRRSGETYLLNALRKVVSR